MKSRLIFAGLFVLLTFLSACAPKEQVVSGRATISPSEKYIWLPPGEDPSAGYEAVVVSWGGIDRDFAGTGWKANEWKAYFPEGLPAELKGLQKTVFGSLELHYTFNDPQPTDARPIARVVAWKFLPISQ